MKAKLKVNGKEFEVDISDEQAKALTESKRTGFERVSIGNKYFTIKIERGYYMETNETYAEEAYLSSRYFNDNYLRDCYIRAMQLFLKLSQWQALNDTTSSPDGYKIAYDKSGISWIRTTYREFGSISFSSREKVKEAIEVFRNDLEWYFNEFKPRLDM